MAAAAAAAPGPAASASAGAGAGAAASAGAVPDRVGLTSRGRSARRSEGASAPSPSAIRSKLTLLKRKVKKRASFQTPSPTSDHYTLEALAVESHENLGGEAGAEDASPRYVRSAPTTPTNTAGSKVRRPLRPRSTAKHRARMEATANKGGRAVVRPCGRVAPLQSSDDSLLCCFDEQTGVEPRAAKQSTWREQSEQFRQAMRSSRA
eukprot:scaffold1280_cov246-Pinguiococcus_pyrenoidosus.AAC.13